MRLPPVTATTSLLRRHRRRMLYLLAAVTALAVATTAGLVAAPGDRASTPSTPSARQEPAPDEAHQPPAKIRTLTVRTDREPAPSPAVKRMNALLLSGRLPAKPVKATVLTDEDCAPDAAGVSHCRNKLSLPGGRTMTVRHPHRMDEVPCLSPGETVRLRPSRS